MVPSIHTERLHLKPYKDAMANTVKNQLKHASVAEWLPFSHPFKKEEINIMLQLLQNADGQPQFWVAYNKTDSEPVASIGLQATGYAHLAQLFYWVHPDHQGQGYATEILTSMRAQCHEWGVIRVQAMVSPDNKPSVRVLEKAGFTQEGLMRKYFIQSFYDMNALIDTYMYASLKDD